jgi:predicted RNA-binding protein (virulence factor B family)
MRVPKMKIGQIARLKVINVTDDGAFLEVGAERGIFMPFAEMIGKPKVGDIVWAKLYTDKSGRLATSMKVSDEIRRASVAAKNVKIGDKVTGAIYNVTEAGAFLFSNERYIVFIDRKEIPRFLKVGEVLDARVTFVREDGRLDASLRETKELAINSDAEKVLKFIQEHGGEINIHDKSDPDEIYNTFKISKAAFKRAIGHLLKERLIEKVDNGFKIVG